MKGTEDFQLVEARDEISGKQVYIFKEKSFCKNTRLFKKKLYKRQF